jgi:putative inorganic carbon (hco3(-)) transporter
MKNSDIALPAPGTTQDVQPGTDKTDNTTHTPDELPPRQGSLFKNLSPFWHDRFVEAGLILSLALYYIVGNENLGTSRLFHLSPLYSLPFLLIFAALCWYRLPFAVALLPLALPYYLLPKPVYSHYSFSIAEIALGVMLAVALLQLLIWREHWRYRLTWYELRDRLGPFVVPILLFVAVAAFSVVIAFEHTEALRAFRQEVLEPSLYVLLALCCLRTRQDVLRVLGALLAAALFIALWGMAQYFLFRNQLVLEEDGVRRVHAMYGSANSIGLFFDYVLPIGLALALARPLPALGGIKSTWLRAFGIIICLPLLLVLYLSQSRGAWMAILVAALFILALSIRNRKVLLGAGAAFAAVVGVGLFFFHRLVLEFIVGGHTSVNGISTATKRVYLWETALRMIHDRPWFGFGMENWLCYYSSNSICVDPAMTNHHYWILNDPVTKLSTGLVDERTLSHPHNILLHVWVSMGLFGLLAFIAIAVLFFWLFARVLIKLRSSEGTGDSHLRWMAIGVAAAMVAALVHGQVDSSFLAQDLAFCFWMLVAVLLILRNLSGTPWRGHKTMS